MPGGGPQPMGVAATGAPGDGMGALPRPHFTPGPPQARMEGREHPPQVSLSDNVVDRKVEFHSHIQQNTTPTSYDIRAPWMSWA